jgi:hypothetical protein
MRIVTSCSSQGGYPGKIIAKVGAAGDVSEPPLHFELLRAIVQSDPHEFLAARASRNEFAGRDSRRNLILR